MKRNIYLLLIALLTIVALAACGKAVDEPALAVVDYLTALVNKDADRVSALSCAEWEPQALMELDSLQAVEARLEGLVCSSATEQDGSISVHCTGAIVATYNGEDQNLDLSVRSFAIEQAGGDYLVCGYK